MSEVEGVAGGECRSIDDVRERVSPEENELADDVKEGVSLSRYVPIVNGEGKWKAGYRADEGVR